MTLIEFNMMSFEEKYKFVFNDLNVRFISYRKDNGQTMSLWNCRDFFAEIFYSKSDDKIINIEGIDLNSNRIDLYIDFAKKADYQFD